MSTFINFQTAYPGLQGYVATAKQVLTNTLLSPTILNGNVALGDDAITSGFDGPPDGDITGTIDYRNASSAAAISQSDQLFSDVITIIGTSGASLINNNTNIAQSVTLSSQLSPGIYYSNSIVNVSGGVTLTGGSTAYYVFYSQDTINFSDNTKINNGNVPVNNIIWASPTVNIGLNNLIYGILSSSNTITFVEGGTTLTGGIYSSVIDFMSPVYASIPLVTLPCYLKGTKILTPTGYSFIESLNVGDNVISKGEINDNRDFIPTEDKVREIKWIGKFKVKFLDNESTPVIIRENTFDDGPFEDLYLSPGHALVFNKKIVPCRDLINETTILQYTNINEIEYYHIELSSYAGIVANGIIAESYLRGNSHDVFTM